MRLPRGSDVADDKPYGQQECDGRSKRLGGGPRALDGVVDVAPPVARMLLADLLDFRGARGLRPVLGLPVVCRCLLVVMRHLRALEALGRHIPALLHVEPVVAAVDALRLAFFFVVLITPAPAAVRAVLLLAVLLALLLGLGLLLVVLAALLPGPVLLLAVLVALLPGLVLLLVVLLWEELLAVAFSRGRLLLVAVHGQVAAGRAQLLHEGQALLVLLRAGPRLGALHAPLRHLVEDGLALAEEALAEAFARGRLDAVPVHDEVAARMAKLLQHFLAVLELLEVLRVGVLHLDAHLDLHARDVVQAPLRALRMLVLRVLVRRIWGRTCGN
mmetsp:Transcript_93818/g.297732  ORF Transcript_93818/g.297732 Transcript_93818/m.297732 type:complete len:330 (+) Transcript_93818:106-1095(+)